ncbi:hypothetical protein EDB86DRAFT_3092680 [Lactarius hatsudake]|nr:hypothetical protein EDB86DRAFT_3092680 [Lactarius hatsudake]
MPRPLAPTCYVSARKWTLTLGDDTTSAVYRHGLMGSVSRTRDPRELIPSSPSWAVDVYPLGSVFHRVFLYHNERVAKPYGYIYIVDHPSWRTIIPLNEPPVDVPQEEDLHAFIALNGDLAPHPAEPLKSPLPPPSPPCSTQACGRRLQLIATHKSAATATPYSAQETPQCHPTQRAIRHYDTDNDGNQVDDDDVAEGDGCYVSAWKWTLTLGDDTTSAIYRHGLIGSVSQTRDPHELIPSSPSWAVDVYPLGAVYHRVFLYHNERVAKPYGYIYIVDHPTWRTIVPLDEPPTDVPQEEDLHAFIALNGDLAPHPAEYPDSITNCLFYKSFRIAASSEA